MIHGRSREIIRLAMPWIAMALFLLVWELVCVVFDLPEILLPRPTRVFEVFFQRIDILLAFCWDTLWTTLVGFFLAIAGAEPTPSQIIRIGTIATFGTALKAISSG